MFSMHAKNAKMMMSARMFPITYEFEDVFCHI